MGLTALGIWPSLMYSLDDTESQVDDWTLANLTYRDHIYWGL